MAAKETIVSTMATMYAFDAEETEGDKKGTGEMGNDLEITTEVAERSEGEVIEEWGQRLATTPGWSPLKAFVLLLFVMLYCPCLSTCIVIWRETGHIKYVLVAIFYTNVLAFCTATVVYQLGTLFV